MQLLKLSLFIPLIIGSAANAQTPLSPKFADIFTSDAIIQRDKKINIWGQAKANSNLILKINSKIIKIKTDEAGNWKTQIDTNTLDANSIFEIIDENNTGQKIENIKLGDVFICSGQSNMEFKLQYATNAEWEINTANDANVWFINIPRNYSSIPLNDFANKVKWQKANSENAGNASAVCFFAARKIAKSQNIPVGIINASWGGSHIEPWISNKTIKDIGGFELGLKLQNLYTKNPEAAIAALNSENDKAWQEIDKGHINNWHLGLNDKNWSPISHLDIWENSNIEMLKDFDGIIYYKTNFKIEQNSKFSNPILYLGRIDDKDETYINGVKIGQTNQWDLIREYKIPLSALKSGDNIIIIKVSDTGGGGGLWGANKPIGIYDDNYIINFRNQWLYKIGANKKDFKGSNIIPWDSTNGISTLYNGMINPIKDYKIKGFFWYQGESNTDAPSKYGNLLDAFIGEIRQYSQDDELPFFMAQLANFGKLQSGVQNSNWAKLRAEQFAASLRNKNVFMASTIDIGDPYDIHPTQKKIIGERLANLALSNIYNLKNLDLPRPVKAVRKNKDVIIEFTNTGGGLKTISSNRAIGFETCEKNGINCQFVDGFVQNQSIILKNISPNSVTIRYLWANAPIANLFGKNEQAIGTFELNINKD